MLKKAAFYLVTAALMVFMGFFSYYVSPIMFLNNVFVSYSIILLVGLVLGGFIALSLRELDDLSDHHHISLLSIVIIGALINFFGVYVYLNAQNLPNPITLASFFGIAFLIPYVYTIKKK